MIRCLTIITSQFGYDGISNVVTNYYVYQNHEHVKTDFVAINPIHEKLMLEISKNTDNVFILSYRNSRPLKYIKELKKILLHGQYQIIHVHGNSSTMFVEMIAAKLAGIKVRIAHSHNTLCDHIIINKVLKPFFLRHITHGFACSKEAGEWLFGKRKYDVISNGIDMDKYSFNETIRTELRNKYNLNDKLVIGHIGRFTYQKNHDFLIDIFAEFHKLNLNSVLLLIGEGKLEEDIKKKSDLLGISESVIFYGHSDKIYELVQAMDIFVFPSYFEGLGIAAIEAQASGLPCVISDTVPRLVKVTDSVSFLPLKASPLEWAKFINNIEINERSKDKEKIREQIKEMNFDIRKNCKDIEKKYSEIINESQMT